MEVFRGKVTDVQFTLGGLGNQFTTIDGRRYWTWWDVRSHPVRVGRIVTYSRELNTRICGHSDRRGDVATILSVEEDQTAP